MLQLATCIAVNVAESKYPDVQSLVRIEFVFVAQRQDNLSHVFIASDPVFQGHAAIVGFDNMTG